MPKLESLYIGIDPSIQSTGFCGLATYDDDSREYYKTAHFGSKKDKADPKKGTRFILIAESISQTILNLIQEQGIPEKLHFIYESPALRAKGMVIDAAELIGFIKGYMHLIFGYKIDTIFEVPPTTLKKFTADYGFATKDEMRKAIKDKYGTNIQNNDEVDAYALAKMCQFLIESDSESKTYRTLIKKARQF